MIEAVNHGQKHPSIRLETSIPLTRWGGRNLEKLGITVSAHIFIQTTATGYSERRYSAFEEILLKKPLLVGFNIKRF